MKVPLSEFLNICVIGCGIEKLNNPSILMEQYLLENWNNEDWGELFYSSIGTAIPFQILIPFSENIMQKAITQS